MSANEERAKEFAEGIYAAIHGAAEEGVSVTEKHRTVILDAWTEEVCALLDERDEPPRDGPLAKGNQELARGLARQVIGLSHYKVVTPAESRVRCAVSDLEERFPALAAGLEVE